MTNKRKTFRVIKYSSIDAGFHIAAISLLGWGSWHWLTFIQSPWLRVLIGVLVAIPLTITIRPLIIPIVYFFISIFRAIMSIVRKELKL